MAFSEIAPVACYKCGGETRFSGEIRPLGREPGSRIFGCTLCGSLTWTPIAPTPIRPVPQPPATEQVAQQQQQIQPPKTEDDP